MSRGHRGLCKLDIVEPVLSGHPWGLRKGPLKVVLIQKISHRLSVIINRLLYMYKSISEKVDVLPIRIVKSNVSSVGPSSERKK